MIKPLAEIVALADLHLKNFDPLGRGVGVENTRTIRKLGILKDAADRAAVSEVAHKFLILCGDIFDSGRIDEGIRAAYSEIVGTVLAKGVKVVHIAGNHPRVGVSVPLASEFGLLRASEQKGYSLVSEGTTGKFAQSYPIGNGENHWLLTYVPFMSQEGLEEALQILSEAGGNYQILFSHFPVYGSYMTDDLTYSFGVNSKLLKPFKGVFLGDFHRRQQLMGHDWPMSGAPDPDYMATQSARKFHCYLGCAAAVNFGEADYPHSYAVIQLGEYPEWDVEFVETNDSPMLVETVTVEQIQDGWPMPEEPGGMVKLRVLGARSELAGLDLGAIVAEIYEKGAEHVSLEIVPQGEEGTPAVDTSEAFISDPKTLVRELVGDDDGKREYGLKILQSAIDQD